MTQIKTLSPSMNKIIQFITDSTSPAKTYGQSVSRMIASLQNCDFYKDFMSVLKERSNFRQLSRHAFVDDFEKINRYTTQLALYTKCYEVYNGAHYPYMVDQIEQMVDHMARYESWAFLYGKGDKKPLGLLNRKEIHVIETKLDADIFNTVYELKRHLKKNSKVNNITAIFTTETKNNLIEISNNSIEFTHDTNEETCVGIPYVICDEIYQRTDREVDPVAPHQYIILGDFSYFEIQDYPGLCPLSDFMESGSLVLHVSRHVNCHVMDRNAFAIIKIYGEP